MNFAKNLVYLRQHYGVTQEGLAEQLGVSRQTISKWEAGTNYPEMDKLLALCDLFNTNLDDLMRGSVQVANQNDTEKYDRHMNSYNFAAVLGVALILAGVGMSTLLDALGWPGNLEAVVFLTFVVVGVVILIVGGMNHSEFKRRNPDIEPRYSTEVLERFSRRYPLMTATGVGLILLDVIFLVGLSPEDSSLDLVNGINVEDLLIAPFMFILAIAVGVLIWAGMQKSKYDLSELTFITRHPEAMDHLPSSAIVKSPEQIRTEHIAGVICGCIMLLATIVFLVGGFMPLFDQIGSWDGLDKGELKRAIKGGQGGFYISWISFVVGGILCGVVYLISSIFSKSQADWIAEARKENAWMQVSQDEEAPRNPWATGSNTTPRPAAQQRDQQANQHPGEKS